MLGKTIKQELRATGRIMLPLLGVLLLLAALAGVSAKLIDSGVDNRLLDVFSALFIAGFFIGLFAVMVIAFVLMIQRFYKNLMGDEGYLMLTLPVTVDAHIFAKLLVSFIWFAVTALVCMLSVLIMAGVNVDFSDIGDMLPKFADITAYVSVANLIGYFLEGLVLCFVGSCAVCLHFYAAIAAGHSFSNHKVLLSVVFYFVISFLLSAFQMCLAWLADKVGLIQTASSFMEAQTSADFVSLLHVFMLCAIGYGLVIAAVCYLPTTLLMKKKLNLA